MTIGKLLSLGLTALSLGCSLHELDYLETPAEDEGSEIRDGAPGENAPLLLVDNAGMGPTSVPTGGVPSPVGDASPAPEAGANVVQAVDDATGDDATGDDAVGDDAASKPPTDDVGVADGSLGPEAQTNATTLLDGVGPDAGSVDSCGFSPGPASCSDGERNACAIKGASCEALASRLGCQPQALCRWPSAGDEAECRALTLLGAWSPSDGPFASSYPGSVLEGHTGACIALLGSLRCGPVLTERCAQHGASCDIVRNRAGALANLCRWSSADDEALCSNETLGIWTTEDSGFAIDHPGSVAPGAEGACITQVANLQP